jgi:Ferredoxin thioredoxin reductase variable alpha chain
MQVGERVRVKQTVVVYTHPEHRNHPFDVQGLEGEVEHVITDWKGRPVSANLPYRVKFEGRFKAHFAADELEVVG